MSWGGVLFLMPRFEQNKWNSRLSNWRPLSEMIICGIPNLYTYFSTQILYFYFCDRGWCFYLHPLREVVDGDEQKLHLPLTLWQWSHDVDPPLCKWPGWGDSCHFFPWDLLDIPIPLAAITFPDKLCCILLHYRPEIACPHDISYEGLCSHVVAVDAPIDFFQKIFGFYFFKAP